MANAAQWTVDQLLSQVDDLQAQFQTQFAAIGANNASVTDLYSQADGIEDPQMKAAVKANLQGIANRQVALQNDFNTAYSIFRNSYNAVASFLRSVGMNAPPITGLSGLGQVQLLVPAAIVGGVLLAAAWVAVNAANNATQQKHLANQQELLDMVKSGQITVAQYLAMSAADTAAMDKLKKPNPSDWTQMVVPALGLLALIILGPQLLKLVPSRRTA